MTAPYTDEDVELVATVIADRICAPLDKLGPKGRAMVEADARDVLDALTARGRLVPPEPDWSKVTDLVVEWPPYGRSPSVPDTEPGPAEQPEEQA